MMNVAELSEEQEAVVNHALKGGPADQVLVEGFKLLICRRDIITLSGLNWLNDEVSDICLFDLLRVQIPVVLYIISGMVV